MDYLLSFTSQPSGYCHSKKEDPWYSKKICMKHIIRVVYYVNKTTCSYFDKTTIYVFYIGGEKAVHLVKSLWTRSSLTYNINHQNIFIEIKQNIINNYTGRLYSEIGLTLQELKPLYFSIGNVFCCDNVTLVVNVTVT